MICSERTPTARKPAHARPAPSPNLLVNDEAIQSVESAFVETPDFCFLSGNETGDIGSDDVALSG